MSEYVMTYMLKQDSPMIHFQGTTQGATLRASEVKPKLDRFLKEWCRRKGIEEKEEWKSDPAHEAYDYKMRIYAGRTRCIYPVDENGGLNQQPPLGFNAKLPSYFGDLKPDEDRRNLWYTDGVKLEIVCFHAELRKIINEAIDTFFVLHNFGTRQNRGIGGFTLKEGPILGEGQETELDQKEETTPRKAEELLVKWFQGFDPPITVYKMVFRLNTDAVRILECGNMFYQILKSGINYNNGREEIYIKSFLTKFFLNKGIGGEKRWMKQHHISPAIGRTWLEEDNTCEIQDDKFRYIRGLLGAAGSISYKTAVVGNDRTNVTIESSRNLDDPYRLARIPSPIRYKIVGNVLFIIPLKSGEDLLGKGRKIYGEEFTFCNEAGVETKLRIPNYKAELNINKLLMQGYIGYIRNDIPTEITRYAAIRHITLPTTPAPNQWIQKCP